MDAGEYVGGIYYPKYIEWKDWGENDRVYPKVDYGFRNGDSMVWYHPVQSVKQIMEYIEEDNGISFIFQKTKRLYWKTCLFHYWKKSKRRVCRNRSYNH